MDCGGCTLCCLALPVPSLGKKAGEPCPHCDLGVGCRIYDQRPDDCVQCTCAYHQAPKCSTDLKPNRCRVLFERRGNIMVGTLHPSYTREQLGHPARGQIASFLAEGLSVILFSTTMDRPTVLPTAGKTPTQVWNEYRMEYGQ